MTRTYKIVVQKKEVAVRMYVYIDGSVQHYLLHHFRWYMPYSLHSVYIGHNPCVQYPKCLTDIQE